MSAATASSEKRIGSDDEDWRAFEADLLQRPPAPAATEGSRYNQPQVELSGIEKSEANQVSSPTVSSLVTTPASFSDYEALCSALVDTPASDTSASAYQPIPPVQNFQESIDSPASEEQLPPVTHSVESLCEKHDSTSAAVYVAGESTPGAKSVVDSTSEVQESTVVAPNLLVNPILPPPDRPTGGDADLNKMNQDSKSLMNFVPEQRLTCLKEGKRKASEDPESPTAAKRIKHTDSVEPESEPKPKVPAIPFPEKVNIHTLLTDSFTRVAIGIVLT